jgi:hypothetical protein
MQLPTKLLIIPFGIALAGLAWHLLNTPSLSAKILTIAILLLGLDQTRMAIVDCDNIKAVQVKAVQAKAVQAKAVQYQAVQDQATNQSDDDDAALKQFNRITLSTIGLELAGFYLAWFTIGGGTLVVLASQIWFNLLAGVQLDPNQNSSIQIFGWRDRLVVLIADTIGMVLVGLWIAQVATLGVAIGLFVMVLTYLAVKYIRS